MKNYCIPALNSLTPKYEVHPADLLKLIDAVQGERYYSVFNAESLEKPYGKLKPALDCYVLDFDSEDLEEAKREVVKVWQHLKLSPHHARIFFSGNKGFHLYLHHSLLNLPESAVLNTQVKAWAKGLERELSLKTLDFKVFAPTQKMRLPRSKHPKSGLYKTEITFETLQLETIENIKLAATKQSPCSITDLIASDTPLEHVPNSHTPGFIDSGVFGIENMLVEDFSNKPFTEAICVQKMWSTKFATGKRHAAYLILIQDSFDKQMPESELMEKLARWITLNDLEGSRENDVYRRVKEVYHDGQSTRDGCYQSLKYEYCSAHCKLFSKLDPNKRAAPTDLKEVEQAEKEKINALSNNENFDDEKEIKEEPKQEPATTTGSGDPVAERDEPPSHAEVVFKLVKELKGLIVKQDKDIFLWKETHWEEADTFALDKLKHRIHKELWYVPAEKVEACFKLFVLYIPNKPKHINLYEPRPNATNFRNGTLWVTRDGNEYNLSFKPHSKKDFMTHCLPLSYTDEKASNDLFTKYIDRLLTGDPEKADKIRALKQLAGAMLVPVFPQIFFVLGKAGSGKSTFVKLYYHLLGGTQICSMVEPKNMQGFYMEAMIHKTVNIHTDVDENYPIPDSVIKTITDRIPMQINRKGRKVVDAFIPAVNVFCANNLPPTKVQDQKVYDRRVTVIKVDNTVKDEDTIIQFEELILKAGYAAMISFAVEGLKDLVASGGRFFKPESSKATTIKWQEHSSDSLQDFIKAIEEGDIAEIFINKEGAYNRSNLFMKYSEWCNAEGYIKPPIQRSSFYRQLEVRGFRLKGIDGVRVVEGFSIGKPDQY